MASRVKHIKTFHRLPVCYQNFFREWRFGKQTPIHYIPEEGNWKRNPETGEVRRVENRPIPLIYPKEFDNFLLGGEGVIKGFTRKELYVRRNPRFWVPHLKRTVLHSEILDKYFEVIVTERTLKLIDQHCGFDSYILETSPQDLKSLLEIKFKRMLLLALAKKDFLPENPEKRAQLYDKYKKFVIPEDEAEWYGLTMKEALEKLHIQQNPSKVCKPLKLQFREEFIEQLKEAKISENSKEQSSWISKLNPFSRN